MLIRYMAGNPRTLRRWLLIGVVVAVGLFGVLVVMTWPSMFVSQGRELTGASIDLHESARFDRASREGLGATVYRITDTSADALSADRQSLRGYPMWSALAFDGYKRVQWQTFSELRGGPDRLLADALFRGDAASVDASSVRSLDDARDLAASLSGQDGVLICGWYTERDGVVTNYFAYVLDLKRRLLVKLSLLT
jgi:hypothetical protein